MMIAAISFSVLFRTHTCS